MIDTFLFQLCQKCGQRTITHVSLRMKVGIFSNSALVWLSPVSCPLTMTYRCSCGKVLTSLEMAWSPMVGYSREKPIPEPSNQDKRLRKKITTLVFIALVREIHPIKLGQKNAMIKMYKFKNGSSKIKPSKAQADDWSVFRSIRLISVWQEPPEERRGRRAPCASLTFQPRTAFRSRASGRPPPPRCPAVRVALPRWEESDSSGKPLYSNPPD